MYRAITSLPVPDSPVRSTVVSVAATCVAARTTAFHPRDCPPSGRTPVCESSASDSAFTRASRSLRARGGGRAPARPSGELLVRHAKGDVQGDVPREPRHIGLRERADLLRPEVQGEPLVAAADEHRQHGAVARGLGQLRRRSPSARTSAQGRVSASSRCRRRLRDQPSCRASICDAVGCDQERTVVVRERVRDERAVAVVQRHRQPVVRQHGLDDGRDLRKHLPDVEHGRRPARSSCSDTVKLIHAWRAFRLLVCHEVGLEAQHAPRGTLPRDRQTVDRLIASLNHAISYGTASALASDLLQP